jgi:integrase
MGKRRGNNEGSIYQAAGRGWVGNVSLGNGSRKAFSGKTRKEVADKINLLLTNQQKGFVAATPERMTVATYLTNWLRNTIEPRDTPNTYAFYESITRVHLIPGLGSIRLVKLSPANVRELLNRKREKGLSRTTVLAIHATLKAALSEAVRDEMLYRNVAMLVRTHDAKKMKEEQQRSFKVLSGEQTAQFLNAISDHPWENFFVVSLMLGIRRGEVVALRWQNIDFEVGEIKILNSIISVRHKGTRLASLKAAGSRRGLRMSPIVRDALVRQLERQREQRQLAGAGWREQDYVFTSANGDHWHPDTASGTFQELLTLAGLPHVRLHDLRHSCATALLTEGTHPKLVQEQLGHSRYQTTMDKYSHLVPSLRNEVADTMESVVAKGREALAAKTASRTASRPGKEVVQ